MSLDEYTYFDGRKVSFDREKVVQIEPHQSGSGTLVRLLVADNMLEMHLSEEYAYLQVRISESSWDRMTRRSKEAPEEACASQLVDEDDDVPF